MRVQAVDEMSGSDYAVMVLREIQVEDIGRESAVLEGIKFNDQQKIKNSSTTEILAVQLRSNLLID
jgi:hypothetical protein